jgi:hypothetical protein
VLCTHFHPAALRRRAYILPMSPMPIIPTLLRSFIVIAYTHCGACVCRARCSAHVEEFAELRRAKSRLFYALAAMTKRRSLSRGAHLNNCKSSTSPRTPHDRQPVKLIHSQYASQEEGRARCAGEHPGTTRPKTQHCACSPAHERRTDDFCSLVPRSVRASSSSALPASSPRSTIPSSTSPICLAAKPSRVSPVA